MDKKDTVMKNRYKLFTVCALLLSTGGVLNAQTTIYDANRLMGSDLNGTARFVGMGGAMGALGGDITTMGTNPAGIGIYRSNDAMVSFGFTNMGSKQAGATGTDKFFGSFDNAGFVFSSKIGNSTPLRYVNFGFNYRRQKSFDKNMAMGGVFGQSQTSFMSDVLNYNNNQLDPIIPEGLDRADAYQNNALGFPWIGVLGYDSHLVNPVYQVDNEGKLLLDDKGKPIIDRYNPFFTPGDKVAQAYTARERGGLHSYDFNIALNFYDRFYLGATVGAYSVDYKRTSLYKEDFTSAEGDNLGGYDLGNEFSISGSGVDFKLGFIWRPIETSSFRIGGAIHTPTFFSLTQRNYAFIDYDIALMDGGKPVEPGSKEIVDRNGNPMEGEYDYRLITPWKFNVNMGYTIGTVAALGLEYEYSDYTSAKLKDPQDDILEQTDDIKAMMKGVHTLRAGVEFKLAPEFAFRLGYNHITTSLKDDAYKYIANNSTRTDTEYANPGAKNNYTLGVGYRGQAFYVDMAYQYSTYKEKFYAFDNLDLRATDINNNNHKVLLTLGLRF